MPSKRLSVLSIVFVAASFLSAALPARAQTGGVMFVTSTSPRGSSITGKQGSRVIEVKHSIVSPRDPQSGLPTGQRQRASGVASGKRIGAPITVVKEIDSASPKFWQAIRQNDVLQVRLEFNSNGKTPKTIELQGATIANVRNIQQGGKPAEEIEFRYEKIAVTYRDGKKSYADDWEAR